MHRLRLIAILGGTGSGKSALGLELADKLGCEIFSLDSLAIYQGFDIVSAKPSKPNRQNIFHYAIDILKPDQRNNAMLFHKLLLEAIAETHQKNNDTLLIIGGSSFYLKSIIDGLSPSPILSPSELQSITEKIQSIPDPYEFLQNIDPHYPIHPSDRYRLNKALIIYFSTQTPPSIFFARHPREAFPYPIEKYIIALDRDILKDRIARRTHAMLNQGLLEEIQDIFKLYGYNIQPANAIGVRESIEFLTQTSLELLQGKSHKPTTIATSQDELIKLISTHTAQLAKRQNTFNQHQFGKIHSPETPLNIHAKAIEGAVQASYADLLRWIP